MSERRVRKTEATRSFDRLQLKVLRVFEAVAVHLSFGRRRAGFEDSWIVREPGPPNRPRADQRLDGGLARWPYFA